MSGLVKSLLGMGNPLLDIMAEVDQATLDKYKVDALAACNGEAVPSDRRLKQCRHCALRRYKPSLPHRSSI